MKKLFEVIVHQKIGDESWFEVEQVDPIFRLRDVNELRIKNFGNEMLSKLNDNPEWMMSFWISWENKQTFPVLLEKGYYKGYYEFYVTGTGLAKLKSNLPSYAYIHTTQVGQNGTSSLALSDNTITYVGAYGHGEEDTKKLHSLLLAMFSNHRAPFFEVGNKVWSQKREFASAWLDSIKNPTALTEILYS